MTNPLTPGSEAFEEALARFVLGEMEPAEAREFARRAASDPALADELRRTRRSYELLGYSALREPPVALRARVLEAAAPGPAVRGRRWLRVAAPAALAASLLLAVVLDDLRLRRELALVREVTETLHQPNVVVSFPLRGSGAGGDAWGRAILDLDAKKAALVVDGLPPLEAGRAYWLWAVVGDEHVPCGRFDADPQGRIVRQFAIPVQEYTEPVARLLVTIEDAASAERPSGPTVMQSL